MSVFKTAAPIWIKGREKEMNVCAELLCSVPRGRGGVLRVCGASFYNVFFDGVQVHFGPARKARGSCAADEIKVPRGTSEITIRVIGYNCPSFNGVAAPSFIIAELETDGGIAAATGRGGFKCFENKRHVQKTVRYSFQRQFTESWDMTKELAEAEFARAEPNADFIMRDVPYADIAEYRAEPMPLEGKWRMENKNRYPLRKYIANPENTAHFPMSELKSRAYEEWLKIKTDYRAAKSPEKLFVGDCGLWDMGLVTAGFFRIRLRTKANTRIILSFSEQADEEYSLYVAEFNTVNLIEWTLPEGEWDLTSFEPYSARYIEMIVMEGEAKPEYVGMNEFAFPQSLIVSSAPEDAELAEIYNAAVRTFRHNVIDIYMDCPSRERAGWLFDSFYTGRAEKFFTGGSVVEKAFLDNYAKGGSREETPGMVNMIYPGEVTHGKFIPQWGMWYALEICEYITERGGGADKPKFKAQLEALVKYFVGFENEFGLLERLDNFNFVEWSALNDRVYDVSWPTNMLYAKMLSSLGEVYGRDDLKKRASSLNRAIRNMAFDGGLFCDRAVRNAEGLLENTDERSETTQYYALFLGTSTADDSTYEPLRKMLADVFTEPARENYPDILKSEMFMGVYLKIDVLLDMNMPDKALKEIKSTFLPMARESGTLWEHLSGYKSRDHGFASYAAAAIDKALRLKKERS